MVYSIPQVNEGSNTDLTNLTKEQIEKASTLKTPEEMLAYEQQEGIELTNEQTEAISGGAKWHGMDVPNRPNCGSSDIYEGDDQFFHCVCCGWVYYV
jgi:hypothetical protein